MSTRCNIIIKDGPRRIVLYHHHDGYPEGVGTELLAYLEREYSEPWHNYWSCFHITNELVKARIPYPFDKEGKKDDEYEVTSGLHGDIEYCYVINCNAKTVRCYALNWETDLQNFSPKWSRVFRRDHLVHIPTVQEREAWIQRQLARMN